MSKRDRYKRLITFASALVLMGILTGIFAYVWYENYSETIVLPYYRRGNWTLIAIYCLLIWLFFKAYGGFKEINLRAMRLLKPSGILVSYSCSAYFDENTFYSMLSHAASDSHRKVQILEKRGAGPDHPILLGYPKSAYLKCAICRVM